MARKLNRKKTMLKKKFIINKRNRTKDKTMIDMTNIEPRRRLETYPFSAVRLGNYPLHTECHHYHHSVAKQSTASIVSSAICLWNKCTYKYVIDNLNKILVVLLFLLAIAILTLLVEMFYGEVPPSLSKIASTLTGLDNLNLKGLMAKVNNTE